jgi:hypothetical protein
MISNTYRLLFLFFFRDFDKGDIDIGFEFTVVSRASGGQVLCRTMTMNRRGVERHSFLVNEDDRSIVNLPGRFVCYWIGGGEKELIYQRMYERAGAGTYVHVSQQARSQLVFDKEGIEKRAENMVLAPRRYHEKFIRLLRF